VAGMSPNGKPSVDQRHSRHFGPKG